MASIGWALLVLSLRLAAYGVHPNGILAHHSAPLLCRQDQANTLLKLKQSFIFHPDPTMSTFDLESVTTLPSWQAGTDCCLWEGITCSNSSSGHHVITALDLSGFRLNSNGIHPVLFNLTSLRMLNLSLNNFRGYAIPSVGFERLVLLTHLNLSTSGISGQVPIGISKLTNLLSLYLSDPSADIEDAEDDYDIDDIDTIPGANNGLSLPSFHNIVANLSNLTELYLDLVSISSPVQDCFKVLAKSVPHLRVLSLQSCGLQGNIDSSLSRLKSLSVINLSDNDGITPGPFPESVMDFLNLQQLQLSSINLQGWFPQGMFRSKNLKVLDLSWNPNLSGHVPDFSNAASLETLLIYQTNFSKVLKPSYFSDFKALTELGIDGKIISMDFLSSFGMLESLRELIVTRLDSPRQLESIFSWFEGINLRSLVFHDCDLSMTVPSSTGTFKNLTSLQILESNFTTQTLLAVSNIRSLEVFTILGCDYLMGQLPSAIGNMSNLESLLIGLCQLSGPIPPEVGTLKKLKSLVLPNIGLSGRIPSTIANLTQLTKLQLQGNNFSGEIPTSIFSLPALKHLDLSKNQLFGLIPEFNGASSHLKIVYLQSNGLTGQIPQSLLVLPNLTRLDISGNNLMGIVDLDLLWRLENLTYLRLSHNKLTVIEGEGSNSSSVYPSQLVGLGLASCGITKIPNLLMRLNHVEYLDLSSNKISGDIPKWIWERNKDLRVLNISRNMFTGMELNSSVIPFSKTLITLDLSCNRLQGQVPMPELSAILLDYSNNTFSSILHNFTLYIGDTSYLGLSNNIISGHLPHSICDSSPEILDLSHNSFTGVLPPCLMENGVFVINFRDNQFKGMLPSNISSACSVQTIDLNGNKIEGQLPRALSNCTDLEVLDLGRNKIADTFPSWLGRLLNLHVLVLRSNQFHGSIGYIEEEESGDQFASLQIIDLASNNFSGELHAHWFENLKSMKKYNNTGQIIGHPNITNGLYQDSVTISYKRKMVTFERILTTLTTIEISDNGLEGSIPSTIGNLCSLRVLNLSHNAFSEEIPPQIGRITALESLDLSSNMLSGEIPQELTNLTFLGTLNLSNNQLEGRIPQSHQFTTFQNSSFDGNLGLCGPPLSKPCGTPPDTRSEKHQNNSSDSVDVVLFLFAGVGFGVGFAIAILVKQDWMWSWFHIFRIVCWPEGARLQ